MARAQTDTRTRLLELTAELFAEIGYAAVSMREIARTAGLTPAALYHHFADKDALYEAVLEHVYRSRTQALHAVLDTDGQSNADMLRGFVMAFAGIVANDKIFSRLLHRELLDGSAARMQRLSTQVFQETFDSFATLLRALAPGRDHHFTANAMITIILGHYECAVIRRSLPGYLPIHDSPDFLADNVLKLVLTGPV